MPNPANPQDLNRYAYVRNNPLKYTDPSGHACVEGTSYCVNSATGQTSGSLSPWTGIGDGAPLSQSQYCDRYPWACGGDEEGGIQDEPPSPSAVASMATLLDTGAALLNGGYALGGDIVGLVCQACYAPVVAAYQVFSFIPNSISTVAMSLWIMDGIDTGENNLTLSQTSQGTIASLSVSQDTLLAVGTNIAGWTILREPNAAFFVDAGVAGYDYGRMGVIPAVDYVIPSWINPTITYSTNTGLDFSWQRNR